MAYLRLEVIMSLYNLSSSLL